MIKYLCPLLLALALLPLVSLSQTPAHLSTADSLTFAVTDFSDTTKRDASLTSDIDLTASPGQILLARGDQKNLVPGSRLTINFVGSLPQTTGPIPNTTIPDTAKMNPAALQDGSFYSIVSFPPGNVGSSVRIDLQAVRSINRIQVVNLTGTSAGRNQRPLAFSYYAGVDSNKLVRIYQELDNQDSIHTAYLSEPVVAQYILFVIDKQSTSTFTVISELRVYGEGYLSDGYYTSNVNLSLPRLVNFGRMYVDADFPEKTAIGLQMRTGNTGIVDGSWSPWSPEVTVSNPAEADEGALLEVAEPRKNFQYRLHLFTGALETPVIRGMKVTYQTSLVADVSTAIITPSDVPVLSPAQLTYHITTGFSPNSLGIDTIRIRSPGPCTVRSVSVAGAPISYHFSPHPDMMVVSFPQTFLTPSTIDIQFSTKLIEAGEFPAVIVSKDAPWNPQYVDPITDSQGNGWTVTASGVPERSLVDVRIDPNPFTPNGDGRNDATVVDFSVAKVDISHPRDLSIVIFDLSGRKIRTLVKLLAATEPFFGDPRTGGKGFLWDGRDDNGKVVIPGVYLLQVAIDIDNGGEYVTKTVIVAY